MLKFNKKKGFAITEYALIGILFALVIGIAIFQISPEIMRKFFSRSVGPNATAVNGTLEMKTLGE